MQRFYSRGVPHMAEPILVAQHGDIHCHLLPALANRHGLITGATEIGRAHV